MEMSLRIGYYLHHKTANPYINLLTMSEFLTPLASRQTQKTQNPLISKLSLELAWPDIIGKVFDSISFPPFHWTFSSAQESTSCSISTC